MDHFKWERLKWERKPINVMLHVVPKREINDEKIHWVVTDPFDYLERLCPLEEAAQLLHYDFRAEGSARENWAEIELKCLVDYAQRCPISPLREPPRVLFLPLYADCATVLLCKSENNGTCNWFSTSKFALQMIEILMKELGRG